ncbi:MAG: AtpZ/AtpI family protein [Bacteroidetes bacterium]|nr:AtpZ/AtpI family protein [Bacteroidota bacterium]
MGKTKNWQSSLRDASPYLSLGMQLAMTMAAFALGGYFLDQWLHTTPWLILVCSIVGMVCIFVRLVHITYHQD